MGRREIEAVTKRTIQTCDLCDRDLGGIAANKCDICGREACYSCSALRLAYDAHQPGWIDMGFLICKECEEVGRGMPSPPLEAIKGVVAAADADVSQMLRCWREAVSDKRKEG